MKTITRIELYNKIWSITKSKTAQELEIPFADLTRICREYDIPTPTSSYWQQLSWGVDVEKAPLPNPKDEVVIPLTPVESSVYFKGHKSTTESTVYSEILDVELAKIQEEKELKKLKSQARNGKFAIDFNKPMDTWTENVDTIVKIFRVPESLKSRRDITLQSKVYLRLQRLNMNEQIKHPDYGKVRNHLDITTGLELHDRALRLFDTIIDIFEALGGKMEYGKNQTLVIFSDVQISVRVSERYRRVDQPVEERGFGSRSKLVPSGIMQVNLSMGYKKGTVEDTVCSKIEDKLDTIVKKTLRLVESEFKLREWQRQQEVERKRREEERAKEEERRRQIELSRKRECDDVRSLFSKLKREMIVTLIDLILKKYDHTECSETAASEKDIYVIKLLSLRNLFDLQRTAPIEGILTELDIDSLASEFFGDVNVR